MFFFPYRIDARRDGLPFLTVLICLLCSFVYWQQHSADSKYFAEIEKFCLYKLTRREQAWLNRVPGEVAGNRCAIVLESIRESGDAEAEIGQLAQKVKPIKLFTDKQANIDHVEKQLVGIYQKFERNVPEHLTSDLAYDPRALCHGCQNERRRSGTSQIQKICKADRPFQEGQPALPQDHPSVSEPKPH